MQSYVMPLGILFLLTLCVASLLNRTFFTYILLGFAFIPVRYFSDNATIGFLNIETSIGVVLVFLMIPRIVFSKEKIGSTLSRIWITSAFIVLAAISASIMMANGESSGFRMLYRLLYPVIAFAYFASNFRKERDIEKVLTSIILIGVAVVTGSIIQYVFFGSGWRISAGVMRYVGLGSASDYAYNMGFLTILCYVRLRSGEVRWVYGALAVLFATGMLLTITRGAIIGTALAVLGYEFFGKHGKLASRLFAASCLIIVLLGTISFYSPLRSRIFAEHYKDIQTKHSMGSYEKFEQGLERSGRPRALRFALREMMGGHHILFGYGIGSAEEDALDALGGLPHNEYVRVFYEMGLLGISIFIASLLQLWLILRRSLLVATTNFQKLVSGIGISLMTLFCAGSMVDNLLSKYKSIGMVLFMIIAFTIVAYKDNSSYAISAKEKALSR